MTLVSAAVLLFFVMDPLGNVPLFLSALRKVDPQRHRSIIVRELVIALGVMLAFLFGGQFLLRLLNVSPAALTAAGGIVLLLIALRMIFPTEERRLRDDVAEPFVVPLAVPYTAGPSVLATELLLISREPDRWIEWTGAICLAWFAAALILFLASDFRKLLSDRGLLAIERLMGMLLVIVAVEMIMNGVAQFVSRTTAQ
jgi:multiple antibiotic resistance protein